MARARTTYDGDFTVPNQHGPMLTDVDLNNSGKLYTYTYRQRATYFYASHKATLFSAGGLPLGTIDRATGGFFVSSTTPTLVGGEVLEWTRTYATVPPTRVDSERYPATYQFIGESKLFEFSATVKARVIYTYYHAPPNIYAELTCRRAGKYFDLDGTINHIGEYVQPGDTEILAEDESFNKVRGYIYEKRTVLIPVHTPEAVD